MASPWLLARVRETIAQLICRQRVEDAAPGTDREQEARSDATFTEAEFVHHTLTDHADEIEHHLAALRADVELARLTRRAK